jgi:hypothetical protein
VKLLIVIIVDEMQSLSLVMTMETLCKRIIIINVAKIDRKKFGKGYELGTDNSKICLFEGQLF